MTTDELLAGPSDEVMDKILRCELMSLLSSAVVQEAHDKRRILVYGALGGRIEALAAESPSTPSLNKYARGVWLEHRGLIAGETHGRDVEPEPETFDWHAIEADRARSPIYQYDAEVGF